MGRPKKQEGGRNTSITLYSSHIKMAKVLVEQGFYENISDVVRHGIEELYEKNINNTEEQLEKEQAKLIAVTKALEELHKDSVSKLDNVLEKYKARGSNLSIKGIARYEETSKMWIDRNMDMLADVFPNKTTDEIYIKLEELKVK